MKFCTKKIRLIPILILSALLGAAYAQDANPPAAQGGGNGQRAGRGGYGGGRGMGMGAGNNLLGTVTAVAADHYTVKTDAGDLYTVSYSANTRIMKMNGMRGFGGGQGQGQGRGQGGGNGGGYGRDGGGGNPPTPLKPGDIKVGDVVAARGEIDAAAKTVGAMAIVQLTPEQAAQLRERAKEMQAEQANYGKTWIMGKVTAIDGVKVTLMGAADNVPHTFVADENTTFRKGRDPITLADVQVGDMVRVDGAPKDGSFAATAVMVRGMPPGGTPSVPRSPAPPN
jgi:hypothetical protein